MQRFNLTHINFLTDFNANDRKALVRERSTRLVVGQDGGPGEGELLAQLPQRRRQQLAKGRPGGEAQAHLWHLCTIVTVRNFAPVSILKRRYKR